MTLPVSVRCWPLLWSLPLLIQSPSDQDFNFSAWIGIVPGLRGREA